MPDDSGGGGENQGGGGIGDFCGQPAHFQGVAPPAGSRAGVGVSGIQDDAAEFPAGDVLGADEDGGGFDGVGGEDGGGRRSAVAEQERDVQFSAGFDAGGSCAARKPIGESKWSMGRGEYRMGSSHASVFGFAVNLIYTDARRKEEDGRTS